METDWIINLLHMVLNVGGRSTWRSKQSATAVAKGRTLDVLSVRLLFGAEIGFLTLQSTLILVFFVCLLSGGEPNFCQRSMQLLTNIRFSVQSGHLQVKTTLVAYLQVQTV